VTKSNRANLSVKFPVTRQEFPVLRNTLPVNLGRKLLEKSPNHTGFFYENGSHGRESQKFPVSREFARRQVRSALRRQPGSAGVLNTGFAVRARFWSMARRCVRACFTPFRCRVATLQQLKRSVPAASCRRFNRRCMRSTVCNAASALPASSSLWKRGSPRTLIRLRLRFAKRYPEISVDALAIITSSLL
jgi:hypothetical protein